MKIKVEKALDDFIETSENEDEVGVMKENKNIKKEVLDEREGLIERVDHIYVDKSGRQLLREQY